MWIKHRGRACHEEGTANAEALSILGCILEYTWLVEGIARRPAWLELREQELRSERCVCVEGGLQAFEGTLAFTLREVAARTWRALSRGLT